MKEKTTHVIPLEGQSDQMDKLVRWLMSQSRLYIFGGLVRKIISPSIHADIGDIDLIGLDAELMRQIGDAFGYVFREVSRPGRRPRYFIAKSKLVSTPIQFILMQSHTEAMQFVIDGSQYDIGRIMFGEGRYWCDESIGEQKIRAAISEKRATLVTGRRDLRHFTAQRSQVEMRHRLKLVKKGFLIIE